VATAISWTDETWNPIIGCSIVSPGCTNCYAMRDAYRKGYNPRLPSYHGLTEKRKNNPIWNGVVRRNSDTSFYKVLKWKNRPGLKVFVNSMGDLFHEEAEPRDVLEVIEIIRSLPDLRFQVLTKREEYAPRFIRDHGITLPPNLWMGMSVENADWKKRIDALRTIPAEIRFVSAEPLVGPLGALDLDGIHWVITGGESGPRSKIRFTNPAWIRDIQKQCSEQGTAFFHKQHGAHPSNFTTGDAGFVFDGSSGGGFLIDGRPYQDFPSIPSPAPVHRASSPMLASASVGPV
jgi:protein gp37